MPLKTRVTEMFGITLPIFGFSHSREVVAAVSRAGGVGVLGVASYSPERVEIDLSWIDANCDGKPYGVDLMIPQKWEGREIEGDFDTVEKALRARIPEQHTRFVEGFCEDHALGPLGPLPDDPALPGGPGWRTSWAMYPFGVSDEGARLHCDIALSHDTKFLISSLGPPPPDIMARCRAQGVITGALVGHVKHARAQVAAGVDVIICQGGEAAAHTGEISTMVLLPDVVEAVAPTPVLGAGGIASGQQMAAALALGAEGVWTGSMWLTVDETDEPDEVVERLLAAQSGDTIRSRSSTGKPLRQLKSDWTDAWNGPQSPGTLPMPLQHLATLEAELKFEQQQRGDLMVIPVGQVVGRLNQRKSVKRALDDMMGECEAALDRLSALRR